MVHKSEIRKAVAEYKKQGKPKEHLVDVTIGELTEEQIAVVTFGIHKDLKRSMTPQDIAAALWNLKLLKEEPIDVEVMSIPTETEARPPRRIPVLRAPLRKIKNIKKTSTKKTVKTKRKK